MRRGACHWQLSGRAAPVAARSMGHRVLIFSKLNHKAQKAAKNWQYRIGKSAYASCWDESNFRQCELQSAKTLGNRCSLAN